VAFVESMNKKAAALGMQTSHFNDPAGLDPGNVASARDTARMVRAAMSYPLIRNATTTRSATVRPYKDCGELRFNNTNRLLGNKTWDIQLSKTGYINESGRSLVMQAEIDDEPLTIVLLDSFGKLTPFGDSNRIRNKRGRIHYSSGLDFLWPAAFPLSQSDRKCLLDFMPEPVIAGWQAGIDAIADAFYV